MIQSDPADAPRIGTAAAAFHRADDFHGPQLGRAADRTRGEGGGQHIHRIQPVGKTRRHAAGQVHDMGETLHVHIAFHAHAAGPRHAPQIVAPQIDQHHMLGLFLGVGAQFGGQPRVFQIIAPATTGSRNGRQLKGSGSAAHHDFRRGTKKRHAGQSHVKHVGRRIDAPQTAIERKGIALVLRGKTHRRHNLNGFALSQQFLDIFHIGLVTGLVRFGLYREGSGRNLFGCFVPPAAQVAVFAQADLAEAIIQMIEHQHRARQRQHAFRFSGRHNRGQFGVE